MKRRSPVFLLGLGAVLISGTLVLIKYLNRSPEVDSLPRLEPSFLDSSLRQIRGMKSRAEEDTWNALRRQRSHLEAIVKAVEKLPIADSATFGFPKGGAPESMRPVDGIFDRQELGDYCDRNTLVRARRQGGNLHVKIVLHELGHMGTYSIKYTSRTMTDKEFESNLDAPSAFERLEDHWWALVEHF